MSSNSDLESLLLESENEHNAENDTGSSILGDVDPGNSLEWDQVPSFNNDPLFLNSEAVNTTLPPKVQHPIFSKTKSVDYLSFNSYKVSLRNSLSMLSKTLEGRNAPLDGEFALMPKMHSKKLKGYLYSFFLGYMGNMGLYIVHDNDQSFPHAIDTNLFMKKIILQSIKACIVNGNGPSAFYVLEDEEGTDDDVTNLWTLNRVNMSKPVFNAFCYYFKEIATRELESLGGGLAHSTFITRNWRSCLILFGQNVVLDSREFLTYIGENLRKVCLQEVEFFGLAMAENLYARKNDYDNSHCSILLRASSKQTLFQKASVSEYPLFLLEFSNYQLKINNQLPPLLQNVTFDRHETPVSLQIYSTSKAVLRPSLKDQPHHRANISGKLASLHKIREEDVDRATEYVCTVRNKIDSLKTTPVALRSELLYRLQNYPTALYVNYEQTERDVIRLFYKSFAKNAFDIANGTYYGNSYAELINVFNSFDIYGFVGSIYDHICGNMLNCFKACLGLEFIPLANIEVCSVLERIASLFISGDPRVKHIALQNAGVITIMGKFANKNIPFISKNAIDLEAIKINWERWKVNGEYNLSAGFTARVTAGAIMNVNPVDIHLFVEVDVLIENMSLCTGNLPIFGNESNVERLVQKLIDLLLSEIGNMLKEKLLEAMDLEDTLNNMDHQSTIKKALKYIDKCSIAQLMQKEKMLEIFNLFLGNSCKIDLPTHETDLLRVFFPTGIASINAARHPARNFKYFTLWRQMVNNAHLFDQNTGTCTSIQTIKVAVEKGFAFRSLKWFICPRPITGGGRVSMARVVKIIKPRPELMIMMDSKTLPILNKPVDLKYFPDLKKEVETMMAKFIKAYPQYPPNLLQLQFHPKESPQDLFVLLWAVFRKLNFMPTMNKAKSMPYHNRDNHAGALIIRYLIMKCFLGEERTMLIERLFNNGEGRNKQPVFTHSKATFNVFCKGGILMHVDGRTSITRVHTRNQTFTPTFQVLKMDSVLGFSRLDHTEQVQVFGMSDEIE